VKVKQKKCCLYPLLESLTAVSVKHSVSMEYPRYLPRLEEKKDRVKMKRAGR